MIISLSGKEKWLPFDEQHGAAQMIKNKGVADINLVQFSKSQEEAFLQAKEMIEKLQKGYQS